MSERETLALTPSRAKRGRFGRGLLVAGGLLAGGLAVLAGCAPNPATGKQDFTLFMSPGEESRIGAEQHTQIVRQYGGVYADPEIGGYVAEIGGRLAANSERPDIRFTFTVLDSPVVNAFALPGGYVYVTRGLVALANSEAELAGVIGHEIGHVVARHSAQRYSQAVAAQLGATILGAAIGNSAVNQLFETGASLYLLSFSRDQEFEADQLGIRYLTRAGYEPAAEAQFLQSLIYEKELDEKINSANGRQPRAEFLQTHPNTPDRVQAAIQAVGGAPRGLPTLRDEFLKRVDGMIYGDSPAHGFVRGQRFVHPELRFAFEVPQGFRLANFPTRVAARGPQESLIIFDDAGPKTHPDIRTYLTSIWAANLSLEGVERIDINGLRAVTGRTRVNTQKGEMDLRLVAIQFGPNKIYRLRYLSPPALTARLASDFQRSTYSFRGLSPAEAQGFRPYRLRVHTVQSSDTIDGLAARLPYADFKIDRFRALNGMGPTDRLAVGGQVKVVVE
ncbi:MAG: peptidase M48 [Alphaproteobacteria bacterium]|nr:peptidase M48 [Alphaproteobacteria bacterium]